jgi:hypothetical protein
MRRFRESETQMLLKNAEDKSKRIALLEELQRSPVLDARQKKWLREEALRLRRGIQGEKESAYFLNQYFKGGENHVVLHDLRFVVDGDVAQIDHLIFNRAGGVYVIETKNYAANVIINDQGEFTVDYEGERFGVPSPIEQSHRQARILQRLFERLEMKNRTGGPPDCFHVVMFHPKAIITRPKGAVFDTSNVIKADQFPSWHEKFVDREFGVAKLIHFAANLRSLEMVKERAEKLLRQHRPGNQLELPDFMQPRSNAPQASSVPAPSMVEPARAAAAVADEKKRLVCLHCNQKITFPEGRFCWNNSVRFRGGQYCREHQALF